MRMGVMAAGLLSVFLAVGGCSLSTPESNAKESLSGEIPVGGQSDFNFTTSKRGEVEATISALTPAPSSQLVMGIGSLSNGRCSVFFGYIANVVVNRPPSPWLLEKGTYCFSIADPNFILKTQTSYTGTLSHP